MKYEWDDAKDAVNQRKHGLAFDMMETFDWDFATRELQFEEGEEREEVVGPIGGSLCTVIVTERPPVTRIISLRHATREEKRRWRKVIHET